MVVENWLWSRVLLTTTAASAPLQWLIKPILWLHLACVTRQVIPKLSPIDLITCSALVLRALHIHNYGNDYSSHVFCYVASDQLTACHTGMQYNT